MSNRTTESKNNSVSNKPKPLESFDWQLLSFNEISNTDLYALLRLRSEVFCLEQECLYQDMDNLDQQARHLLVKQNGALIACARLFQSGIVYPDAAAIGRLVVAQGSRQQKLGFAVMQRAIKELSATNSAIKISAQHHLVSFYEQLGFRVCSEVYMEDGIPHVAMLCKGTQSPSSDATSG